MLSTVPVPPPLAGPLKGLIGCWKFDDGKGREATDSSGNGNVGRLEEESRWKISSSSANPGAIRLDGDDDYVSIGRNRPYFQNVA